MREIQNIQDYNETLGQNKPVLVDFFADWCGPCQALMPILNNFSQKNKGQVEVLKVNVDKHPELAQQFGVRSIPALFFIEDKKVAHKLVGLQSESRLQESLDSILATS